VPAVAAGAHALTSFEILLLVNERHRQQPEKSALIAGSRPNRACGYSDRPFNYSLVNNWGPGQASGELVWFLNDSTSNITPTGSSG
jgi:hypothetical protein